MSAATEFKTKFTPEDLLEMPDGINFELVDGELVERHVSALSSLVAMEIGSRLRNHCKPEGLGWIFGSDLGYQCFPHDPKKIRRADVSFIRRGRLTDEELRSGFVHVVPDLAVEVVSPHDLFYELSAKVREYLAAGVPLVWVVNPLDRTVQIHRADGSMSLLGEREDLSGEDVVPNFRCRVGELFPPSAERPNAD